MVAGRVSALLGRLLDTGLAIVLISVGLPTTMAITRVSTKKRGARWRTVGGSAYVHECIVAWPTIRAALRSTLWRPVPGAHGNINKTPCDWHTKREAEQENAPGTAGGAQTIGIRS